MDRNKKTSQPQAAQKQQEQQAQKQQEQDVQRIPKNLVEVKFSDGVRLSYFSDFSEIKKGDVVTVEGKLEKSVAVVTKVLKSFKKPKFDMRWITSIVDMNVEGHYYRIGEDMVAFEHSLTAGKILTILTGEKYNENEGIGEDDLQIVLKDLENSEVFDDELIKMKGRALYKGNAVTYIYLKSGAGKAIVRGSQWYEIDFRYENGVVTYLACDCPYFGYCKHVYAFLLKLRETLKQLSKAEKTDEFVLCQKQCFHYILSYVKGKVTLEL
ncbi:MAG: hypothetical protein IKD47_00440 [Clostridia bacterium]|nr:hypothetical protein [Clostridia bacterium]